jgi:hypothetical protein
MSLPRSFVGVGSHNDPAIGQLVSLNLLSRSDAEMLEQFLLQCDLAFALVVSLVNFPLAELGLKPFSAYRG